MSRFVSVSFWLTLAMTVSLTSFAAAQTVTHVESMDGELSGDNANPTSLGAFGIGTSTVSGTIVDATGVSPNVDVFTFSVATGNELQAINVNAFESNDDLVFIGLDDSTSFPFDASALNNGPDQSQFIGGILFGGDDLGNDILPDLGAGFGSGFTAPLGAGDYTVYLQQLGGTPADYELGFDVGAVPEPSSAALLFSATVIGLLAGRRRR